MTATIDRASDPTAAGQAAIHPAAEQAAARPATEQADHPDSEPEASFESLGVAPAIVEALAASGIERPFPVQAVAIPDALAGMDVCGKAKTGSGKTLAFGIPLLMRVAPASG
ncbi:MAG: DEAD/DEAH box helicase, partial [Actinobacteria bacterium]|nr:DEAD/DEAH box helicase [Actinomycetota bacterium]